MIESGVVPAGGRAFPRPADQGALAALCDARRPGRRRRQPHDLHRAVALPAQLVRAPPRPGHQHRLHRSRHRRHRAAALAAGDHRPGRLARLVLGHGPAGASRARPAEPLRAAQAAGYRPVAGRGIVGARDRQAAQCPHHRRSGLGVDGLDDRPGDPHRPLLVARARLFPRPRRLVRGAGPPDQVPHRRRVQSARWPDGPSGSSASLPFPGRSASAPCPTASAGNGCGRQGASASSSATPR